MGIETIRDLVERELRRALTDVNIDRVTVTEDTDKDGDAVLNVRVVYEDQRAPSGLQVLDALVDLQDVLHASGETRFPLFSFVARSEANEAAT